MVKIHRTGVGGFESLVSKDLGEYMTNADAKVGEGYPNEGSGVSRFCSAPRRRYNRVTYRGSAGLVAQREGVENCRSK